MRPAGQERSHLLLAEARAQAHPHSADFRMSSFKCAESASRTGSILRSVACGRAWVSCNQLTARQHSLGL